jgi:DNA-directed RNA polymerase specialized sigma24 family protein
MTKGTFHRTDIIVNRNDYATHSDFCAIFRNHLDHLYLLAMILAGHELIAEKCFLAAFDSCAQESRVFRESALSWSRRSVIKYAIRIVLPAPGNSSPQCLVAKRNSVDLDEDASLKCLQDLPPFERFVFVMSVLERYSVHECALLLGCRFDSDGTCPECLAGLEQFCPIGQLAYEGADGPEFAYRFERFEKQKIK